MSKSKSESTVKTVKAPKVVKLNKCGCGCGTMVKRTFAQGHDAKLHSNLLKRFRQGGKGAKIAEQALVAHNWAVPEVK